MVIQCSGYFVYGTGSIQELVVVIGVIGRVILHFKIVRQEVLLKIDRVKCEKTLELTV